MLVDGEGQTKHSAGSPGRITHSRLTPELDYVVGDATSAYAGRLLRYRRHVAFVKPDLIVLYDDLSAPQPATFQFLLHALAPFTLDEKSARLGVQQSKAGVTVRYLSPALLAFRQWDGYDPKPTKEFPNQWHIEASTREKRRDIGVLTVIAPHRAGQSVEWTAERLESDTAVGAQVRRGGKTVLVAFRKEGVPGAASLAGLTFEGAVAVR